MNFTFLTVDVREVNKSLRVQKTSHRLHAKSFCTFKYIDDVRDIEISGTCTIICVYRVLDQSGNETNLVIIYIAISNKQIVVTMATAKPETEDVILIRFSKTDAEIPLTPLMVGGGSKFAHS